MLFIFFNAVRLLSFEIKLPSLKLKTWPKQLLCFLSVIYRAHLKVTMNIVIFQKRTLYLFTR
jgi:hypothetical protein